MSALDLILATELDKETGKQARAELAQLRAKVEHESNMHAEYKRQFENQAQRIAEQARQLAEARKVIERCSAYIGSIDYGENTKSYQMCDAWLAANPAPKPQEDSHQ